MPTTDRDRVSIEFDAALTGADVLHLHAWGIASEIANDSPRQTPIMVYDYSKQAWVKDGHYISCGHVDRCGCYGKLHAGEPAE